MRVEEHTIELGGTPVFYRLGPSSGIPVLYLHGVPTSSDDWLGLLERTGGVAPDLLGFGRSGKGGNLDYSLEGHAAFIERLLDHLQIERVQLVAHDRGAGGGLVFAARHPGRVQRLVLCDALPLLPGFSWRGLPRVWRTPLLGELVMGSITEGLLARWLRRAVSRPEVWSDDRVAAVWAQFDQGTQRAILRLHRAADPERLAAYGRDLKRLEMPSLVVHGEADAWFEIADADRYGELLPDATVVRVPGAGHWPWLEQPSALERIAQFLAP